MQDTKSLHTENNEIEVQRLDKWLNISCLFKTRAQATKACDDRKIKVNGEVAKPAKMIKAGDVLTIKNKNGTFINYTVTGLAFKNVSAKDARTLYIKEEIKLSDEAKELMALHYKSIKKIKPKYKGRPTKKERRKMDDFKKGSLPWS
ncbi:RNA-binding S4 domain-containing protein [candidate division KSB1 bacterium]|nr:RNA-binding S4 domain-containing protein [candidate division KSB1 bacterium]